MQTNENSWKIIQSACNVSVANYITTPRSQEYVYGHVQANCEDEINFPLNQIDILIAPLSDIQYLTMHKVHMHAGAIRQLLYGCAHVLEIIHSLKLVDYPPVHTHIPYNNLYIYIVWYSEYLLLDYKLFHFCCLFYSR